MSAHSGKVITVIGGTGQQGGSVVRCLLEQGQWNIRVLTRNKESSLAKDFASRGVDILVGDARNDADVVRAVRGADVVFFNLNFWDDDIKEKEVELGKNIADILKKEGVTQVVYSSLPNCERGSNGKYKVLHFTGKAEIAEYISSLGFEYVHFVEAPMYYQNYGTYMPPKKSGDKYVINIPGSSAKGISMFDTNDYGHGVILALSDPDKYNGKYLELEGDVLSPDEVASLLTELSGKKVEINYIPYDEFAKFYPGAQEFSEMFHWFYDFGYYGPQDSERRIRVHEGQKTLRSFYEQTRLYEKILQ